MTFVAPQSVEKKTSVALESAKFSFFFFFFFNYKNKDGRVWG